MVKNRNENTDDLQISCIPNVLLVNSGVYDLTNDNTSWIFQGLHKRNQNAYLVKEISPNYLFKDNFPLTLIIHGMNDRSVPFSSAERFVKEMYKKGNTIKFYPIKNAGHFIWKGRYGKQVSEIRSNYLENLGY